MQQLTACAGFLNTFQNKSEANRIHNMEQDGKKAKRPDSERDNSSLTLSVMQQISELEDEDETSSHMCTE